MQRVLRGSNFILKAEKSVQAKKHCNRGGIYSRNAHGVYKHQCETQSGTIVYAQEHNKQLVLQILGM